MHDARYKFIYPFKLLSEGVPLETPEMRHDTLREGSLPSLISCWEIFFNPLDELHADFSHVVPSQGVLNKSHIHSHLDLNQIH